MSLKKSFMDNELYGADDINFALSQLTTQGVSLFKYTPNSNPLTSLNDAVSEIASPGVDNYNVDSCKVTYDSDSETFSIGIGTAFMPDGSFITIEDNPEDITDIILQARENNNGALRVYFYRNTQKNTIDIRAENTDGTVDKDKTVLLAEISESNSVTDMRDYAQAKIAPASGNIIKTLNIPKFAVYINESGAKRLRAEFDGVFHGATHCIYNNTILSIQKAVTTDGSNLEYTQCPYASSDSRCFVALNLVGTTLQIWMYTTTSRIETKEYEAYIF